jgi:hypothetical protein
MTNQELIIFFKEMNIQLEELDNADISVEEYYYELDIWKKKLLSKLNGAYYIKVKRLSINNYDFSILQTILRDMYFKYNINKKKSKENIEREKLLKAREGNIDFELELAKMITGDNTSFPYRSSFYLTEFFQSLGHAFTHNGETRKEWVKERLEELNIIEIHHLLSHGLFKRKYYSEHVDKLNKEMEEQVPISLPEEEYINIDSFFNKANKEFEKFIKDSIVADKPFDLSNVLDMNVNIELLFDNKANTKDEELNKLIEEAKERFLSNDKTIGLEKLWDAFERFKTHFDNGKKKKQSLEKVLKIISEKFDEEFIENEFKNLTKIGNNYRIRHHETDKKELTSKHINYFFFRMMSLIDLCLMYLNEEEL